MKKLIAIASSIIMLSSAAFVRPANAEILKYNLNAVSEIGYGPDTHAALQYIENKVFLEAFKSIDREKYYIEDVKAVYISKEYIEELSFNGQKNVYFGYTTEQLNSMFKGAPYYFTTDANGNTIVQKLEGNIQDELNGIYKNLAIGAGVIIVCFTIAAVSGGVGAPAVKVIFTAATKGAAKGAAGGAAIGGLTEGSVAYLETGDIDIALKRAALCASEGFMTGAIMGAVLGGAGKALELYKGGYFSKLSDLQVSKFSKESGIPKDIVKEIHSVDEYKIYKDLGVKPYKIGNRDVLLPNIDKNYIANSSKNPLLKTNGQLMAEGKAPFDPATGSRYNLHHIGQNNNGPLVGLPGRVHEANSKILHWKNQFKFPTEVKRDIFDAERQNLWKNVEPAF